MTKSVAPIHPAATAICIRDGRDGVEVLLVRRNSRLVFHGGAWVFPGGRVDASDCGGSAKITDECVAREAAVRESFEEASLRLCPEALVTLSHWTTPPGLPRRFSTWFFLADAPADPVRVDEGEIDQHWWVSPALALERRHAGSIELPPPTFVTLVWLEALPSVQGALAAARGQPFERYVPKPVVRPDGVVSLYEGDAGYATRDLERAGPRHRLWMLRDGWRYERTPLQACDDG